MQSNLYVIGNGFDCAHGLPVRFDPDFKKIAQKCDSTHFWDIYQSEEVDIWSDFENLLAVPDFNSLEEIFEGYMPDYMSDRESDRDNIICQVSINGNLDRALTIFAAQAEDALVFVSAQPIFITMFTERDYFITFNYTHTLEKLYDISPDKVLHIHGEIGGDRLLLGYPEGDFAPEKYLEDVRMKGVGPYREADITDYIDGIEDYYIRTAYQKLFDKCKSFSKEIRTDRMCDFMRRIPYDIEQIIVYGHSCAIDFKYFEYLIVHYPKVKWIFYIMGTSDEEQGCNVSSLIERFHIRNYEIKQVG